MPNRPSYAQIEALVEFLQQNPGIAKGLLRSSQAKTETRIKWDSVATSLNALGGAIKDGKGWAKEPEIITTTDETPIFRISPIPCTSHSHDEIMQETPINPPASLPRTAAAPRRVRLSTARHSDRDMERFANIEEHFFSCENK